MKIETYNKMNLIPIGNVSFTFTKNFRPSKTKQKIYVGDINIMHETDRHITPETEKALMSMMKKSDSDLLTDGRDFYTTTGGKITQIRYNGFYSILNMHKDEIHELLYK